MAAALKLRMKRLPRVRVSVGTARLPVDLETRKSAQEVGEARRRLHLRDVASGAGRLLLADELAPNWSRNGRMLAWFRIVYERCSFEVVDVFGLAAKRLASCVAGIAAPARF